MNQIMLTKPGTYEYILDKSGQEISIIGRFQVKRHKNFKINIKLIHQAMNTKARISLKAVVESHAKVEISGTVIVKKSASKTESFLEEKVLLLSPTASAIAVPNLEILNNEVQCTHAATVSPIDENQLFYLTSRGIPKATGIKHIAKGFLTDTIPLLVTEE